MKKYFLKEVEATLFDFEGTLVDFQWKLTEAVQEVFEMLRTSGFPMERIQSKKYSTLMKEAMRIAMELGRSSEQIREKIGTIYDRYDEDALTRWTLRPKARDFLSAIKGKGVKTGLVSNVGEKALEKALQKTNILQFFDVIISRNDVQNLKPSGEGIDLALNRLQVTEEKSLFIGDSLDDIHAAKEAGLRVIIILGGENPKPELLSAKPDYLINDFGELLIFLEER